MDRLANFVKWFCQFASKSAFRRISIVSAMRLIVHLVTVIAVISAFYWIDRLDLFTHVSQLQKHFAPKSYLGFLCGCLSFITCVISIAVPSTLGFVALAVEHGAFNDLNTYLKGS